MNRMRIVAIAFLLVTGGYAAKQVVWSDPPVRSESATLNHFGTAERRAFDVLRGPTRPLPNGFQETLKEYRYRAAKTLWFNTAKYVPSNNNGFWVVNGKDVTCIIQNGNGGLSCSDKQSLFRMGIAVGYVKLGRSYNEPEEFVVWGLAPDWAKRVIIHTGNKQKTIAIHRNAYSLRSKSPVFVKHLEP
jgi:hypothetical protein